jgi:hypothetical protein
MRRAPPPGRRERKDAVRPVALAGIAARVETERRKLTTLQPLVYHCGSGYLRACAIHRRELARWEAILAAAQAATAAQEEREHEGRRRRAFLDSLPIPAAAVAHWEPGAGIGAATM